MDPDWDPATMSSSFVLICRLSMGVVWPVKLCKENRESPSTATDAALSTTAVLTLDW